MPKDKQRRVGDGGESLLSRKRKRPGISTKSSVVSRHMTRRMTKDAARDAVLYTAELLEQIFEYLPSRSILIAQRVCHQFRDIVARSSNLQAKMLGKDESAVQEKWIIEHFARRMGGGVFFHRMNQEALALVANDVRYPTFTLVTPNDMIFCPWLPQMTEAEHAFAVKCYYSGDVFQLVPSLRSALLELRSDQKKSWQVMELCSPLWHGPIDVFANIRVGPWILQFRHCILEVGEKPMTLGSVFSDALNYGEDDEFVRHAWAYLYDGKPECLNHFTLNHWPYIPFTTDFPLGARSLREVITEKEQEYGVGAVMDVAPSIRLRYCIQPSESVKRDIRSRGSEEYVVAELRAGRQSNYLY